MLYCKLHKNFKQNYKTVFFVSVVDQSQYIQPRCLLPDSYTGTWYYKSEYDVDVVMNLTHIYFKTNVDQFWYKESYFICQAYSDSRYLMTAITVGKWWVLNVNLGTSYNYYSFYYSIKIICIQVSQNICTFIKVKTYFVSVSCV